MIPRTVRCAVISLAVLVLAFTRPLLASEWSGTGTLATSALPGWPHSNVIDGNLSTAWSSAGHSGPDFYEHIAFIFPSQKTNSVRLLPRMDGGQPLCVPESIDIYYLSGGEWHFAQTAKLPADPPASGYLVYFTWLPIDTNGILISTNRLRPDQYDNYYFQLADVKAGLEETPTEWPSTFTYSSSALSAWPHTNVRDGDKSTAWSSNGHGGPDAWEYLAFFYPRQPTNYIRLFPRTSNGVQLCIPESIDIYYRVGETWTLMKSVALASELPAEGLVIHFPQPITTDGILLSTERLRHDDYDSYYFQLAEVYAGLGTIVNNRFAWKGTQWVSGIRGPGQVWVDKNQALHLDLEGHNASLCGTGDCRTDVTSFAWVPAQYKYETTVVDMHAAETDGWLVSPLWMSKIPWEVSGEMDHEFYVLGPQHVRHGRYTVFKQAPTEVPDEKALSVEWPTSLSFANQLHSSIEWHGSHSVTFATEIGGTTAHEPVSYTGSDVSLGTDNMHINFGVAVHADAPPGPPRTMVLIEFLATPLSY